MSRQGRNSRRENSRELKKENKTTPNEPLVVEAPPISRKERENNIRKRFLILCEGETEQAYFEGITQVNELLKHTLSGVQVQVVAPTHDETRFNPERNLFDNSLQGMIWEAMQRKRLAKIRQSPYNEIWIIVDDDDDRKALFERYEQDPKALFFENDIFVYGQNRKDDKTKPKAKDFDENWKKYIQMGYSCRSFEVWLLLHFEKNLAVYTDSDSILKKIKTYASPFKKGLCESERDTKEGNANAYQIMRRDYFVKSESEDNAQAVLDKISTAIENAVWLRQIQQNQIVQNQNRFFGINPFTNVDALLVSLLERDTITFTEINQVTNWQGWQLMIHIEPQNGQVEIHLQIAENQRLLINSTNIGQFVWIEWRENHSIKRQIPTLNQTLNLPTVHGLHEGSLSLQFSKIMCESSVYLHIRQNKQRLICPIF